MTMETETNAHDGYVMAITQRVIAAENIQAGRCFACGGTPSTGLGEHVIPKWLQTKFSLYDERLTLLNGTHIPYRQLTIPCCEKCNNGFLSSIETEVQAIHSRGACETPEDHLALGRWMAKILVGILVKETSLLRDRKVPELGRIVPADFIEELHHCQLILQSARKTTEYRCLHGRHPFSLYWYKISQTDGFDLSTNVIGQSVAIRMGGLGVVFVNDGGLQLTASALGPFDLLGKTVTPFQFSELSARIHYKSGLRDATHLYMNSETPELLIVDQDHVRPYKSTILSGGEMKVFEPWNNSEFAQVAASITGIDAIEFYDPETGFWGTTLGDLVRAQGRELS